MNLNGIRVVFIKEMRQNRRSGAFWGVAVIALIPWLIGLLNFYAASGYVQARTEQQNGQVWAFCMMAVFLGGIIMAFLSATRLSREIGNPALDPALTTSLSPWCIIGGKLLAAGTMAGLIFLIALPVLTWMFPRREMTFFGLVQTLILCALELTAACLLMYLARPKSSFRKRSNIAGIILLIFLLPSLILLFVVGSNGKWLSSGVFGAAVLGFAAVDALLFVGAVQRLRAVNSDRMILVNVLLFVEALVLVPGMYFLSGEAFPLREVWSVVAEGGAWLFLMIAVFAPEELSRRNMELEEKSRLYRWALPFQQTACGGLILSFLLFCFALALDPERSRLFYNISMRGREIAPDWERPVLYGLSFFYTVLTLNVRRMLEKIGRRMSSGVLLGLLLLPGIVCWLFGVVGSSPAWQIAVPFSCPSQPGFIWFYVAVGCLGILLAVPVFVRRFRQKKS